MRVQWTAKSQCGETAAWAGTGAGTVLQTDGSKPGFGVSGEMLEGPAVLVQFDVPLKLKAWVPPYELEPLAEESR